MLALAFLTTALGLQYLPAHARNGQVARDHPELLPPTGRGHHNQAPVADIEAEEAHILAFIAKLPHEEAVKFSNEISAAAAAKTAASPSPQSTQEIQPGTHTLDMPLDHFGDSGQVYKNYYYIDDGCWDKENGPIFVSMGGEGGCTGCQCGLHSEPVSRLQV
jgi:hypothetical protein